MELKDISSHNNAGRWGCYAAHLAVYASKFIPSASVEAQLGETVCRRVERHCAGRERARVLVHMLIFTQHLQFHQDFQHVEQIAGQMSWRVLPHVAQSRPSWFPSTHFYLTTFNRISQVEHSRNQHPTLYRFKALDDEPKCHANSEMADATSPPKKK